MWWVKPKHQARALRRNEAASSGAMDKRARLMSNSRSRDDVMAMIGPNRQIRGRGFMLPAA